MLDMEAREILDALQSLHACICILACFTHAGSSTIMMLPTKVNLVAVEITPAADILPQVRQNSIEHNWKVLEIGCGL